MSNTVTNAAPLSQAGYDAIANMLLANSGLCLGAGKTYLLETRLAAVLKQHGIRDLASLADQLIRGVVARRIVLELNEAMTINETSFFRDRLPFDHLGSVMLPFLHGRRASAKPLRIWSAASSTGQEAYTIAMVAAELGVRLRDRPIEIVGTDLSASVVARATEGRFTPFEIGRGLPARLRDAYFTPEPDGGARVNSRLRSNVRFRQFNLLDDTAPLGCFDIVFCRNVLIYFDASRKRRILDQIARQLAPDGVLYLGGSESVSGVTDRFTRDPQEPCCRLNDGPATVAARLA